MATYGSLEELAVRHNMSVRTAQRWLAAGRVERVVLDDGEAAYRLSDEAAGPVSDAEEDRAEREDSLSDNDVSDTRPAEQSPGPPRRRPVDHAATASTTAARVTRRVRDLVGASYVATLAATEAVQALVTAATEQVDFEAAFTVVPPPPGQPGEPAWRAIAAAVATCADALRQMLARHTVADEVLADVDLRLRDAERRWREARRWELDHLHGDAEPLRRRAAEEARTFAEAFSAIRDALTA